MPVYPASMRVARTRKVDRIYKTIRPPTPNTSQRKVEPERFRPKRSNTSGLCGVRFASKIVIVSSKSREPESEPVEISQESWQCRYTRRDRWAGSSSEARGSARHRRSAPRLTPQPHENDVSYSALPGHARQQEPIAGSSSLSEIVRGNCDSTTRSALGGALHVNRCRLCGKLALKQLK